MRSRRPASSTSNSPRACTIRLPVRTAKSPREQRLEYETHRLQVHEDKIHREIQTERRLLNEVEAIAADAAYDAREAYRDARYGYGSPYHRNPYITSPYLRARNLNGHPGLTPGLGIGISPHLDAAQSVAAMQVRRDMAIAQQARRRLAQQFDSVGRLCSFSPPTQSSMRP